MFDADIYANWNGIIMGSNGHAYSQSYLPASIATGKVRRLDNRALWQWSVQLDFETAHKAGTEQ